MPAKDIYHNSVKNALEKESWHITNDPFILRWGARDLYIDLGAQKLIAAEKSGHKIAVEVKSFISASPVADLEKALGQYILYYDILIPFLCEAAPNPFNFFFLCVLLLRDAARMRPLRFVPYIIWRIIIQNWY